MDTALSFIFLLRWETEEAALWASLCPHGAFPPADVGAFALCPADAPSPSPWFSVAGLSCWSTLVKKEPTITEMMIIVISRQQVVSETYKIKWADYQLEPVTIVKRRHKTKCLFVVILCLLLVVLSLCGYLVSLSVVVLCLGLIEFPTIIVPCWQTSNVLWLKFSLWAKRERIEETIYSCYFVRCRFWSVSSDFIVRPVVSTTGISSPAGLRAHGIKLPSAGGHVVGQWHDGDINRRVTDGVRWGRSLRRHLVVGGASGGLEVELHVLVRDDPGRTALPSETRLTGLPVTQRSRVRVPDWTPASGAADGKKLQYVTIYELHVCFTLKMISLSPPGVT